MQDRTSTNMPEGISVDLSTSDLIIGITSVFDREKSYEAAMQGVLAMISDVVHPERLIIFERGETTTSASFEWCAEGVPSQKHHMQNLANERFDMMSRMADKRSDILESSIKTVKTVDEELGRQFDKSGVASVMAVPLKSDGQIIGYLSANNYQVDEGFDVKRVLDTVASFVATRIVNQRLLVKLEQLGTHDSLTGLLNRLGLDLAIDDRLRKHPGEPYVLAIMDIDDFKIVNDLHGHDVGDAALRSLADALTNALPSNAIVGRNGGDEFLAVLFDEGLANADALFKGISTSELGCMHAGKWYPLTMSMGYAFFPEQATDLNDAYAKADIALYAVKLAGKSGCAKYSSEAETKYRSQLGFTPRDLTENIPCAIAVCKSTDAREILFANTELIRMMGCTDFTDLMEFTGGTFEGIVHPDDRISVASQIAGQIALDGEGRKTYTDYRVLTKDGQVKNIVDSGRRVHMADIGEVCYVLMVDMGERARIQSATK